MAYEKPESYRENFGKFIYQILSKNQDSYQETLKDLNKIILTKCVFII